MTRQVFILLILAAAVFTTTQNCLAQNPAPEAPPAPHDHSHISKSPEESSAAQKYFTDVELLFWNDISDEALFIRPVFARDYYCASHLLVLTHDGFDLSQLDAMAANLDL